tara:strand:+ start:497 stop:1960 length:1464 start_codon:yes stop_codon:yes gene_type:complete
MNLVIIRLLPSLLFLACVCNLLRLEEFCHGEKPYQPKLTDGKSPDFQDFPMGVLSATGRLHDGEKEIVVRDIGKGSVAESGGLQVGDRILSIGGKTPKTFDMSTDSGLEGPQEMLGKALETACSSQSNLLLIKVKRGEEHLPLQLKVPPSPVFASTFPKKCLKTRKYFSGIVDHLVDVQLDSGSWRPGVGGDADVYMSAFCALAVLSSSNKDHLPAIKAAIDFIRKKSITQIKPNNPKVGPKSWQAASSAILLAEYQLATGDKTFFPDLQKCCDLLAGRVSGNGRMGHYYMVPYEGTGLVIINVQAHLAWALAAKCGYKVNRKAWNRSMIEIRKSVGPKTGGLGYSSRVPDYPDIPARTGAMTIALSVANEESELTKGLANSLIRHQNRMRHAHSMTSIGLIFGMAGIKSVDPKAHEEVIRKWIPYLELCRTSVGTAAYFGSKRNYAGDAYLGYHPIGNATVALMLASAESKLFIHGGTKLNWLVKP